MTSTNASDDVDLWAFAVNYNVEGVFTALNFAYIRNRDAVGTGFAPIGSTADPGNDFDLYVVSADVDYGTDMWSAYFDGLLNFGENKQVSPNSDFKGWGVMAGGTFNATDTITVGADVYVASGQKYDEDDTKSMVTAGAPSGRNAYNMDEVIFPGWFDDDSATIITGALSPGVNNNITSTGLGTNAGYTLTNIMAIGAHADFKPMDKTLVQVGGAYMAFMEDVASKTSNGNVYNGTNTVDSKSDKLGYSFYARLSQGIVDGLTLKAVAGYFVADDGFAPNNKDDDAYRLAMGLFWSW
jgi:hypothetical protein